MKDKQHQKVLLLNSKLKLLYITIFIHNIRQNAIAMQITYRLERSVQLGIN